MISIHPSLLIEKFGKNFIFLIGFFYTFAIFYTIIKTSQRLPVFFSDESGVSGVLAFILILSIVGTNLLMVYGCFTFKNWLVYTFAIHSGAIILSAGAILPWYGLSDMSLVTLKNGIPFYILTVLVYVIFKDVSQSHNEKWWPAILYGVLAFIIISIQVLLRL
jgi:hypothetical protein